MALETKSIFIQKKRMQSNVNQSLTKRSRYQLPETVVANNKSSRQQSHQTREYQGESRKFENELKELENEINNKNGTKHIDQEELNAPFSGHQDPNKVHMMGNTRVFIGNLPPNTSEKKVRTLLAPYGELSNCYVNAPRGFAMVQFITRQQAYRAQVCLHCTSFESKSLVVRLAPHPAALWVGELSPVVSNEVLFSAFSRFGDIEKAIVVRDDRGRSCGYGFVEFKSKNVAISTLEQCKSGAFLLTRSPHPIQVELFRFREADVGLVTADITNDCHYFPLLKDQNELSKAPRFIDDPYACDERMYSIAKKWKSLFEDEKRAKEKVKVEFAEKRKQLDTEMKQAMKEADEKINEMRLQQERLEKELAEVQSKIQFHQRAQSSYATSAYTEPQYSSTPLYQHQQHQRQHNQAYTTSASQQPSEIIQTQQSHTYEGSKHQNYYLSQTQSQGLQSNQQP